MTTSVRPAWGLGDVETSHEDWFLYYVALFNKSQATVYAQLALWYLLIALCEGADWANVEDWP